MVVRARFITKVSFGVRSCFLSFLFVGYINIKRVHIKRLCL